MLRHLESSYFYNSDSKYRHGYNDLVLGFSTSEWSYILNLYFWTWQGFRCQRTANWVPTKGEYFYSDFTRTINLPLFWSKDINKLQPVQ